MKDQINNFRHVSEDAYWPTWKKGEERREKILRLLERQGEASIKDISAYVGISPAQARRHRANLVAQGLWKITGCAIALASALAAGAYYADADGLDEFLECRVKSPILEIEEEILWNWEQRFL